MGSGKVAPAPVRAVPWAPPLEPLESFFLLLHAPATRATTSSSAAAEPTLWNLLMRPPCPSGFGSSDRCRFLGRGFEGGERLTGGPPNPLPGKPRGPRPLGLGAASSTPGEAIRR